MIIVYTSLGKFTKMHIYKAAHLISEIKLMPLMNIKIL